jgi:hypothetical protein
LSDCNIRKSLLLFRGGSDSTSSGHQNKQSTVQLDSQKPPFIVHLGDFDTFAGKDFNQMDYEGGFLRVELDRTLLVLMARTGAVRATSEQKQAFGDIAVAYDKVARTPDLDSIMQLDKTMFNLFCDACHNEHVCRATRLLVGENRRLRYIHFQKHADIPVFARIRAELARALHQGDPEAAEAIVHRRMDYIESTLKGRIHTNDQ